MVLYLVGLGLGDEKDITVRGLEMVRGCSKIFLEHYTSVLGVDKAKLEDFYGKEVGAQLLSAGLLWAPAGATICGPPYRLISVIH